MGCAKGGGGHAGGENVYAGVREKSFWRVIYCANPKPDSRSQYNYRYRMGTGKTSSIDHAVVQPFDHNCNTAVDPTMFLKFFAMSQLKFSSMRGQTKKNVSVVCEYKTEGFILCYF